MLVTEWEASLGSYIILSADVSSQLNCFRQLAPNEPEAGGVLLGYRRDPHIEVVAISTPKAGDVQMKNYFERIDPQHEKEAIAAWKKDPYIHYLGEWHTHPELNPTPSSLDVKEWKIIGCRDKTELMVMLIVGQETEYIALQKGNSSKICSPVK